VRDYRTHLVTVAKNAPRTINTALAAIDDFYTRRSLGPASADRLDLPTQAPRALDAKDRTAVDTGHRRPHRTPRPGAGPAPALRRAARRETVALDVDDVRLSARKGTLRVRGKGGKPRDLPIHAQRHTFATTQFFRGGTDLVTVADMLGHVHLDTVRLYTHSTVADRERALNLLPYDR
jgi:integrase